PARRSSVLLGCQGSAYRRTARGAGYPRLSRKAAAPGRPAPAHRAGASATLPDPSLQVNDVSHSDFSTLPLPAPLLDSIQQLGYQQMTPHPRAALPVIL